MIIGTVFIIDGDTLMRNEKTKTIEYNNLENIQPDRENILIEELRKLTGLQIKKVDIEHIDYVKNRVVIKVYYSLTLHLCILRAFHGIPTGLPIDH